MRHPRPPCPVCGEDLAPESSWACEACRVGYHRDCWDFAGGCAVFGCGSSRASPAEDLPEIPGGDLVLDESSLPPTPRTPLGEVLRRRLLSRAHLVPRTLVAGISGSLLSIGVLHLTGTGMLSRPRLWVGAGLVAGALYGLVAPYLAGLQMRLPGRLALGSLAVSLMGFHLLRSLVPSSSALAVPGLALILAGLTLWATSLGEWAAGWRSRLAQRSPSLARLLRLASTWGGFALGVFLMAQLESSRWRGLGFLYQIGVLGVLGVGISTPALETGKAALLEGPSPPPSLPEAPGPPSPVALTWTLTGGLFGAAALAAGLDPGHWVAVVVASLVLGLSEPTLAPRRARSPQRLALLGAGAWVLTAALRPWLLAPGISLLGSVLLGGVTAALIQGASGAAASLLPASPGEATRHRTRALLTWGLAASALLLVRLGNHHAVRPEEVLALLAWTLPALALGLVPSRGMAPSLPPRQVGPGESYNAPEITERPGAPGLGTGQD